MIRPQVLDAVLRLRFPRVVHALAVIKPHRRRAWLVRERCVAAIQREYRAVLREGGA